MCLCVLQLGINEHRLNRMRQREDRTATLLLKMREDINGLRRVRLQQDEIHQQVRLAMPMMVVGCSTDDRSDADDTRA